MFARAAAVGLFCIAGSTMPAAAQPELPAATDLPPPAAEQPEGVAPEAPGLTGRELGGFRLPVALVDGVIELEGNRAFTWLEPEHAGPDDEAATRRILLSGDVRVRLGTHVLTARRASVWMARLPEGDPEAAPDVWQVFVYLDQGRTIAGGPFAVSGRRVPVTAILRTPMDPEDAIELRADQVEQGRPADSFVDEGEAVLARRLARLAPAPPAADDVRLAEVQRELPPSDWPQPIFAADGIVTISAGEAIQVVRDEEELSAVATGGVNIQYWSRSRNQILQLSAERAAVFLDPEVGADVSRLNVTSVRGIYLEGNVTASDGQYTVRAPRVYYDIQQNRAMLLDAVFWAYDPRRGMPMYLRASTLRQLSANQFQATSAQITNTAFFDPDLAIGLSSVTLTRIEEPEGTRNHLDARHITLRAGGIPFFYLPILRGDPDALPLRGLGFVSSRGAGSAIQSSWNAYSLIGLDPPQGHSATFIFDYYFDRGPALGFGYEWTGPDYQGNLLAYGLPDDRGRDRLLTGQIIDPPQDTRGVFLGQHREDLDERWTVRAEGAYFSDPTFVQVFFERERWAKERREFTNAVHLQRVERNELLSFEARARLQDFLVNDYLLQTPGYSVDKLPEVMYFRSADDVLVNYPGLLTWTHEYRAGIVRMNFHEPTAREIGFGAPGRALAFWGIGPDQSPADVLRAQGLHEDPVLRLDTRQELSMPMMAGPVNITPFVVGRATFYDQDFETFSPQMDDPYRLWGAAGLTLSTELVRVDNSVSSRFFDLHRIRHIVRPSVTGWHGATTVDRVDLPVYDADVEDLMEGSVIRFGIDQTWQTQRGGPGRWRSVDVFRLNTELVVSSGDSDRKSPIPRFFDYRPELGNFGGTFGMAEAAWQATEVLGFGGLVVYDFETDRMARASVGMMLEHTPDFSLFTEIRHLGTQDQTYAILGVNYALTRKYSVMVNTAYDTDRDEFTVFSSEVRRRFPNVILGLSVTHNRISGDTAFGLLFQPVGLEAATARVRGMGASVSDAGRAGFGG